MEEDFRQKNADLEQQVQKVQSSTRVMYTSLEDMQKKQNTRLQRIELDAGDRLAAHEETREALMTLHGRLEVLEDRTSMEEDQLPVSTDDPPRSSSETLEQVENNSALLSLIERRMGDVNEKLARVVQDSIDLHQNSKQHEVQLSSLRTHLDAREEQVRKLAERLENSDFDGKIEQFRRTLEDDRADGVNVFEKIELLGRRLDNQEQSHEVLRSRHDQLMQHSLQRRQLDLSPEGVNLELELDAAANGCSDVKECINRIAIAETRLADLDADLQCLREANDFGPQVGTLVTKLTEIVPKVIDHERKIGDLNSSYSQQQAELQLVRQSSSGNKDTAADLDASLSPLRLELKQTTETALENFRGELSSLMEVMRQQARQSIQAAEDLKEVRSIAEDSSAELQRELENIRGEVRKAAVRHQSPSKDSIREMSAFAEPKTSPGRSPRLELASALQQDEEVEREKQQRVLERIDELCDHIAAVDSAVALCCRNGSQAPVPLDGIPAELSEQFKVLADRVEEQSRKSVELHSQVSGKFDQLDVIIRQAEAFSRQTKS
jgi:hypothetical protein